MVACKEVLVLGSGAGIVKGSGTTAPTSGSIAGAAHPFFCCQCQRHGINGVIVLLQYQSYVEVEVIGHNDCDYTICQSGT